MSFNFTIPTTTIETAGRKTIMNVLTAERAQLRTLVGR